MNKSEKLRVCSFLVLIKLYKICFQITVTTRLSDLIGEGGGRSDIKKVGQSENIVFGVEITFITNYLLFALPTLQHASVSNSFSKFV